MNGYKIDIGCGANKKLGTVGIDIQDLPGVDYVLDLKTELLPFPDASVEYVYSNHFFEHLPDPTRLFAEISRVAQDGAQLEFWTPYAFSNPAFIIDHKCFFNEDHYMHICVWHTDFWKKILKARWILKEFHYIIEPEVLVDLYSNKMDLDFALRYYKNVVKEFCTYMEVQRKDHVEIPEIKRTFSLNRGGHKYIIKSLTKASDSNKLDSAIIYYSEHKGF